VPDFRDLPKQWLVSRSDPGPATGGRSDGFAGLHIRTAARVPVLRLIGPDGHDAGRLIGWVIDGDSFHRTDAAITLPPGTTAEDLFERLAGRFVMLWQAEDGRLLLREDANGNLPAVYSADLGAVAATVTALEQLGPLGPDRDVQAIFEFPARRGFLPFGLTSRSGARRLMPNHVLDLGDFSTGRIWPNTAFCTRPTLSPDAVRARAAEAGQIVRSHMKALLSQGETVLYLSGGHDSRMVLAAASGLPGDLRCETLGTKQGLDAHIAAQLARIAGRPHRTIPMRSAAPGAVAAWLRRSGYMVYDFVAEAVTTVEAHAPANHPLSGTGAELGRATNWTAADLAADGLDLDALLTRIRMPATPVVRAAGQAWLDDLPTGADAAMILDLAKIEQIHACWAGAAIYGHPVPLPSMQPFSGQRLNALALSLPRDYRMENALYHDYMAALAGELLAVPVNRVTGLSRLRFWRQELSQAVPAHIKRRIKPFR